MVKSTRRQQEPLAMEKHQLPGVNSCQDKNRHGEAGVAGLQRSIALFSSFSMFFLLCWCGVLVFLTSTKPPLSQRENGHSASVQASPAVPSFRGIDSRTAQQKSADKNSGGISLDHVRYGVMAGGAVMLATVIAATICLHNHVVKPLKELRRTLSRMSQGHLEEPVPRSRLNQIGGIGDLVNDLAADLQEVLLHIWNHTSHDLSLLNRIAAGFGEDSRVNGISPEIRKDFDFVRRDIENMQAMVKAFHLYRVQIVNEKVVSEARP
jgi:methyl-accepting chemotaxis protein